MKIQINNGLIIVSSEDKYESTYLLEMAMNYCGSNVKTEKKSYWKKSYKKECDVCGKKYKNVLTHKKIKHNPNSNFVSNLPQLAGYNFNHADNR
jgi:23S rRNA U2552 (ribose-2'-O)-methylase RlmE/FtsJ